MVNIKDNKMKKYLVLNTLILIGIVFFSACKKDDDSAKTADAELGIVAQYGNENFVFDQEYENAQGDMLKFESFRLYLSNIYLINDADEEIMLDTVFLFNLSTGNSLSNEIPSGSYKGIKFGVGLDSDMNASDPNTFDVSHPLSYAQNTHWDWAALYRFILIDGRFTAAAEARTFSYHTGFDELYRMVELNKSFDVVNEGDIDLNLQLDIKQIFQDIDMYEENQSHDLTSIATRIADNIAEAFSLETN